MTFNQHMAVLAKKGTFSMPRSRPLVLTVDDNPDLSALVHAMFSVAGFDCIEANSGRKGLEEAYEQHPDLIILDWMMPDVEGVEVLKKLKASPSTRRIPVVIFSAKDQPQDLDTAYEAGADDFWIKSKMDFDDLIRRSSELISHA